MADVKSCGFLLYRTAPDRSFLLMRHADRWDLPKGHVDPGETKIQAAYRELNEETGIKANDFRMDGRFKYKQKYRVPGKRYGQNGTINKTLIVFLGELLSEVTITADEHLGYEWFSWSPPHQIQERTIDPLLAAVESFWEREGMLRLI